MPYINSYNHVTDELLDYVQKKGLDTHDLPTYYKLLAENKVNMKEQSSPYSSTKCFWSLK